MSSTELPEHLKSMFGKYEGVVFDGGCDECIGWGYKPLRHLGEDAWSEAEKYGTWVCLGWNSSGQSGEWVLVSRWLTPEEAMTKYGEITEVENHCIAYGTKKFISAALRPDHELIEQFWKKNEQYVRWTIRVTIRQNDEPSLYLNNTAEECRRLSRWYANEAELLDRMQRDGWKHPGDDLFERTEAIEDAYPRSRLTSLLKGLDVRINQLRREKHLERNI